MAVSAFDAVSRMAPHAHGNYLDALRHGDGLFHEHDITTPLRLAHFLAQALHETGGFTVLRESMSYSAPRLMEIFGVNRHSAGVTAAEAETLARQPEAIAERVYGLGNPRKARELGNTEPGDGFRYRGNGVLQTTGRGNHKRMGTACGADFESNPQLVIESAYALKPALHEWTQNKLNARADKNDIRTITLRINGGLNGLAQREAWFKKAWSLLKSDAEPVEAWRAASKDSAVLRLQKALNDLGASPALVTDGRYGAATRQAVKAFQTAVGIVADGVAGPVTQAAIKLRLATLRGA
ncbi:peptidoglycan-binding protein [Immundisolibacter sp.]|uniref:peptidoglycan-binding protein n=1 Tax=Immundisolibacter sp. TaxID=1934948 RepID=UPI0035690DF5